MDVKNILYKYKLFQSIDSILLEDYFNKGKFSIKNYSKNEIVHLEKDECKNFEFVLTGKLSIDRISEDGNILTITQIRAGSILGANLLFSNKPYYPMTIISIDYSDILSINKDSLLDILSTNKVFLKDYLAAISDNANILTDKIKYNARVSLRDTIIHYLNKEMTIQESKTIRLQTSKKLLAEHFGVQRTSLSRELAKMKKDGLIDYDAHSIKILY